MGLFCQFLFIVTLFWCWQGCESQRQLKLDSFTFMRDAEGQAYAEMVHSVQCPPRRNFRKTTTKASTREISDSYWCLSKYVQKLHPQQSAFFQRPSPKAKESDMIWYENSPLGVNTLATMIRKSPLALDCLRRTLTPQCEQPPSQYGQTPTFLHATSCPSGAMLTNKVSRVTTPDHL